MLLTFQPKLVTANNNPDKHIYANEQRISKETTSQYYENFFRYKHPIITPINMTHLHIFISNYFTYHINISKSLYKNQKDIFSSKCIPNLTPFQFISRIIKYTQIETSSLISAFFYILKLLKRNNMVITNNNSYNLLLVACVISIKFNEDVKCDNNYYAQIGGLKTEMFNKFEYEFCVLINFELFINDRQFEFFVNELFES